MPRHSPHSILAKLRLFYWSGKLPLPGKPTALTQKTAVKWLGWLPKQCYAKTTWGFTLAELLIALAILGVIATFTIPKIITAQQNAQNAAVFKETISAFNAVVYQGMQVDGMTVSNFSSYIRTHMNAVKICNSNSSTQGCWDTTIQGTVSGGNQGQPGIVLHNGAVIVGLDNCCGGGFGGQAPGEATNDFNIDVNGIAGPNLANQDQFFLHVCFGTVPCTVYMTGNPGMLDIPSAAQQAFLQ